MINFYFLFILFIGEYLIYFFIIGAFWYCYRAKNLKVFMVSLFCALTTIGIGWLFKNYFYLPRPYIQTGSIPLVNFHLDGSSPSNHAGFAFAMAFFIYKYFKEPGIIFLSVAGVIALGRFLGGVHSALDLLGGLILAWAVSRSIYYLDTYHSKC